MTNEKTPELSDVKQGPGGFRRSRGARYRAAKSASVSLQDTPQDISGAGSQAEAFAQGLNSFFPGLGAMREARHAREMDDIRQENEDLAVLAQNLGTQNPEKMQHALETGDWSAFGDAIPDGATTRRAFVETSETTIGALQGNDMAQDPQFLEGLASAPDLEEYRAAYLKDQLKGTRPLLAQAATERFTQRTEQLLVQERQRRTLEQSETGLARARKNLAEEIASGDLSSPADLARHEAVFRAQGAIVGPTQAAAAVDQMYDELFKLANQGDARAIRLVNARDPQQYNGTSAVDRRKYDWEEAEKRAMANVGHVQELTHQRELFQIKLLPADQQLAALDRLDQKWDPTEESLQLRAQAMRAMQGQVDAAAVWNMGKDGLHYLPHSDVHKVLNEFGLESGYQEMLNRGLDSVEATTRMAQLISNYGAPENVKWSISQDLRGDDPVKRDRAVLLLRSVDAVSHNANDVLTPSAYADWVAVQHGMELGISVGDTMAAIRENGRNASSSTEITVMKERYHLSSSDEQDLNVKGVNAAIKIATQNGLDVGASSIPFMSPDAENDDEVQAQLVAEMRRTVRFLAVQWPDKGLDELYSMGARYLAPRLQVEYINGSNRVTLGSADTYAGPEGQEGLRFKSSRPVVNATVAHLNENRVTLGLAPEGRQSGRPGPSGSRIEKFGSEDLVQGHIRVTSLRVDEETRLTNSYAVSVEGGAGPNAVLSFEPGQPIEVPESQANSALFKHWARVPELPARQGHVIIRAPEADTPDEEGTFWHVANDRVGWRARPQSPGITAIPDAAQVDRLNTPRHVPNITPRPGMVRRNTVKEYLDQRTDQSNHLDAPAKSRLKTLGRGLVSVEDAEKEIATARTETLQRGRFLLDFNSPEGQQFWQDFQPILEENEGFRKVAYDDHTGLDIIEGTKVQGDPTVGFGFNLKRPDARKILEGVGLDYDAVVSGRTQITRAQAAALSQEASKELARFLWDTFKGSETPLKPFQWQALMSLSYNSRWKGGKPTLIGPKLTKAIKAGDWQAAADEIRLHSAGGVPEGLKNGIRLRRAREAALFLGRPIPSEWAGVS